MDEDEVTEVLSYVDTNGDGSIDFTEFIEMIKEITWWRRDVSKTTVILIWMQNL